MTYFFSPKWGTQLEGVYSKRFTYEQTNDYAGIPSSDSDLWSGGVQLIRRFSRTTDGLLGYTYSNVKYTGENVIYRRYPVLVNQQSWSTKIIFFRLHSVDVGVNYAIEQDILLSVSAGWTLIVNDVTDNEEGGAFNLVLRKTLQRGGYRIQAGAGYDLGGAQAGVGLDAGGLDTGGFDVTAQNLGIFAVLPHPGLLETTKYSGAFMVTYTETIDTANIWIQFQGVKTMITSPALDAHGSHTAGAQLVWGILTTRLTPTSKRIHIPKTGFS